MPQPIDLSQGPDSLLLYATGLGYHLQLSAISVTVGTTSVPVLEVQALPGASGVDEVYVSLPSSLKGVGTVFVQLTAGSATSNTVTINIP
jgi:uncharacterized protein (TIGR03437 family)